MRLVRCLLPLAAWLFAVGCTLYSARVSAAGAAGPSARMSLAVSDSVARRADTLAIAVRALRARVPDSLMRLGPGMQRLFRERLAADMRLPGAAGAEVLDELLPDGGRLPIAALPAASTCSLGTAEPSQVLLDAAVLAAGALTRGHGGPRLELRDLACSPHTRTEVVGVRPSEYAAGRQQEANPEFARLQVNLAVALSDLQSAEADNRAGSGLMSILLVRSAQGRVNDLRKQLAAAPTYTYAAARQPYTLEVTEARASTVITAQLVMSDPVTGWSDSRTVSGTCERSASGYRGARRNDLNGYDDVDATVRLPSEREMLAMAFDVLRARAAGSVVDMAGQAALRRAVRENRRGRGGSALGWLLLAHDCGLEPPRASEWERALAHARELPYARLGSVRLRPFTLPTR